MCAASLITLKLCMNNHSSAYDVSVLQTALAIVEISRLLQDILIKINRVPRNHMMPALS
jgi:hypothetical protein